MSPWRLAVDARRFCLTPLSPHEHPSRVVISNRSAFCTVCNPSSGLLGQAYPLGPSSSQPAVSCLQAPSTFRVNPLPSPTDATVVPTLHLPRHHPSVPPFLHQPSLQGRDALIIRELRPDACPRCLSLLTAAAHALLPPPLLFADQHTGEAPRVQSLPQHQHTPFQARPHRNILPLQLGKPPASGPRLMGRGPSPACPSVPTRSIGRTLCFSLLQTPRRPPPCLQVADSSLGYSFGRDSEEAVYRLLPDGIVVVSLDFEVGADIKRIVGLTMSSRGLQKFQGTVVKGVGEQLGSPPSLH